MVDISANTMDISDTLIKAFTCINHCIVTKESLPRKSITLSTHTTVLFLSFSFLPSFLPCVGTLLDQCVYIYTRKMSPQLQMLCHYQSHKFNKLKKDSTCEKQHFHQSSFLSFPELCLEDSIWGSG